MDVFVSTLLLGIRDGAVYASIALALVLIFRTTGILNFAQGEMALFSAYLTWKLTTWGIPVWLAIVISMALSFVGGAAIERVVIRPVEQSNPLVIVIVTIGMFLSFNAITQVIFGTEAVRMPRAYPLEIWVLGDVRVSSDVLVLSATLVAVCILLYLLLQKTLIGLALRAVSVNPQSTRLLGVSVGSMLMLGWGLAAALGALAGSLVVPTLGSGLTAGTMQPILVFAFAAAAIGGFDSVVGAVVGGVTVGIANAITIEYLNFLDGVEIMVPFGLILVVLLFRPSGLFGRVHVERV